MIAICSTPQLENFNVYYKWLIEDLLFRFKRCNSYSIQMFDKVDIFQGGTPKKIRKLNHFTTPEDHFLPPLELTEKKSFIDSLHFIGAIGRKDSYKINDVGFLNRSFSQLSKVDFEGFQSGKKIRENSLMDIEASPYEEQKASMNKMKLCKKYTMLDQPMEPEMPEFDLRLYKNNSMFDVELKINETEEGKYGDNVYIQQIMTLERSARKVNEYLKADDDKEQDEKQRLLQDYQIAKNIHGHVRNHENLLCLNKLQRIFYYVKKIVFSQDIPAKEIKKLTNLQTKLYNRDEEGYLLRFYQSWVEEYCMYLIFQTASTSLEEKRENGLKMRENDVWGVLNDCSTALEWMLNQCEEYHLNIKPGNILKCRDTYKLADPFLNLNMLSSFLSIFHNQEDEMEKLQVSFAYQAPEIIVYRKLLTGLNLHKCDIYSLGISILQNLTAIPIISLVRQLPMIRKHTQKYLKGYSPALRNLLMRMVHSNPQTRPTAQEICHIENEKTENKHHLKRKLSL